MKLGVNLVGGGRYYRAGEEVAVDLVPPSIAKLYAVSEIDSQPERADDISFRGRPPTGEHLKRQPRASKQ